MISSSFGFQSGTAPEAPFHLAASELFIDAALRGITVLSANGDGGSGNEAGNGVTNVGISRTSGYSILQGGTSLSTVDSALADATLGTITDAARPATTRRLGGHCGGGRAADRRNGAARGVEEGTGTGPMCGRGQGGGCAKGGGGFSIIMLAWACLDLS